MKITSIRGKAGLLRLSTAHWPKEGKEYQYLGLIIFNTVESSTP